MSIESEETTIRNNRKWVGKSGTVRPRAIVAMDTENMSISLRDLLEENLDLKLIDNLLNAHYEVIEKLAFIDITRVNGERKRLEKHNWCIHDVVTRPSLMKDGRKPQIGNKLDVGLSVITLEHCLLSRPDVLILLSGDGDYIPLVESIRARNIKIHVISPSGSMSHRLLHYCDYLSPWEIMMDPDRNDGDTIVIDHGHNNPRWRSFLGAPSQNAHTEDVFRKIVEILKNLSIENGGHINAPVLKPLLKKTIPYYDEVERKYKRFKELLQKGQEMGYFSLRHEHPRLLISLEHNISLESVPGNGKGVV